MTATDFKRLPPLVPRAVLLKLGWSDDYLDTIRHPIRTEKDVVPFGKVGWLPMPSGKRGLYRRADAGRILGGDWKDA